MSGPTDRETVLLEEVEQPVASSGTAARGRAAVGKSYRSRGRASVYHCYGAVIDSATNVNLGMNHGTISQTHLDSNRNTVLRPLSELGQTYGNELFTLLNPIVDASHMRNLKYSPPNSTCLPGTRREVLKKIRSWADSSLLLKNPHIMWTFGYGGCGKSAIAQEVAMYFAGENRLAASFFFFRAAGDRSTVARFAPTLAGQIAAAIPGIAPLISAAISANSALLSIEKTSLSQQVEHLIYRPINAMKWGKLAASLARGPFLIVLDGIDECGDQEEVAAFIKHAIQFFERKPRTPLRFLIISRVEDHIHQCLHSSKQVRLLDLVNDTSNEDILCALNSAIAEKRGHVLTCDESWPPLEDKMRLVEHVGGSFIFLTTILKSLFDPCNNDGLTPMQRLPLVLGMKPDFDELYTATLTPWKHLPRFSDVISAIALALEPLSVAQIANILSIETANVVNVLVNLQAIIQIPGDDRTPIIIWHTSLRDFLCSRDRAGRLLASHRSLAYGCLSVVADSTKSLETPPATEYSRRFAKEHLVEFLNSLDNATTTFNQELDNIIAGVQKAFPPPSITDLHLCVFDKIVHHLEGVDDSTAEGHGCATSHDGSMPPPLPPNTSKPDVKWTALQMVINPERWLAIFGRRTTLQSKVAFGGPLPNVSFPIGKHEESCLHAACRTGRRATLELLLLHGTGPNAKDNEGQLPLCVACHSGHAQCATTLLDYGANTDEGCMESLYSLAVAVHGQTCTNESITKLDESICLHKKILKLNSLGNDYRTTLLTNLAASLYQRFKERGSVADLDEEIPLCRELLKSCHAWDNDRPRCLESLVISLHKRFKKQRSVADLDEEIPLRRELLRLHGVGHKDHAKSLSCLATSLSYRFTEQGSVADLDEEIPLRRELLELRGVGHKGHAKSLSWLAASLSCRFAEQGSVADLDEEIPLRRELLKLHGVGHKDHAKSLSWLATSLSYRFTEQGSVADLDEEIPLRRELLKLHGVGHKDRAESLNWLATSLSYRFKKQGSVADLDEEIPLRRELLNLHGVGHKDRVESLSWLTRSLFYRFMRQGSVADLDEEIPLRRELLKLHGVGHKDHPRCLKALAIALHYRFLKRGSVADLVEESSLCRDTLELHPLGHTGRAATLCRLAQSLVVLYGVNGDLHVFKEAVSLSRESLAIPAGDYVRVWALDILAYAFQFNPGHLDEALQLSRESLSIVAQNNYPRWELLKTLALILHRHYERSGSVGELDEAVSACDEAISLCPPHQAWRPQLPALQVKLAESQFLSSFNL